MCSYLFLFLIWVFQVLLIIHSSKYYIGMFCNMLYFMRLVILFVYNVIFAFLRKMLLIFCHFYSCTVLEANPWRETSKPVYVLTHRENQLCTMKTRRNRRYLMVWCSTFFWMIVTFDWINWFICFFLPCNSEVERELGLLFSKGGKWRSGIGNQAKQSRTGTKFQMLVEDIREGVLVSG